MHKLTEEYKSDIKKFEDFKLKVEVLIKELLIQNSINYHKIESRVKDFNKLEEKIFRKNEKYNDLEEITDLVGIRIITYFENEVDKIAEIVNNEFIIDNENSIDKRKLEANQFGYRSLHYVVSLKEERKNLTEYKRFGDLKFEIQVRSILQHAWAEIEHDLGYKSELSIPDEFKRNFYRVAALLEVADIEFVNIKKGLNKYENNIDETIRNHPEDVKINLVSLNSFISTNKYVKKIDIEICKKTNNKLESRRAKYYESILLKIKFLEIKTIQELENLLKKEEKIIIKFAIGWIDTTTGISLNPGVSIFYLCYILIAKKDDFELANLYYKSFIGSKTENQARVIKMFELYKKISNDIVT